MQLTEDPDNSNITRFTQRIDFFGHNDLTLCFEQRSGAISAYRVSRNDELEIPKILGDLVKLGCEAGSPNGITLKQLLKCLRKFSGLHFYDPETFSNPVVIEIDPNEAGCR